MEAHPIPAQVSSQTVRGTLAPVPFAPRTTKKGDPYGMSHIVTIQTRVHDPAAIGAACRRLNLPVPVEGTARLYSGEATGLLVQLPGWLYPAVIDTSSGEVRYDTFEGRWKGQT